MVLPIAILMILSVNLAWSIITKNTVFLRLEDRRFLVLTDIETAAGLLALATTFVLTRSQWAKLYRPSIAFAIDDEGKRFLSDSAIWRSWLWNAGPGGATFVMVHWQVQLSDEDRPYGETDWLSTSQAIGRLCAHGFVDGSDFSLREFAAGAALPATTTYDDGFLFAWFTIDTLRRLRRIDVRVCVRDHIGDWYQRRFAIMEHMPSVVKARISGPAPHGLDNDRGLR